MRTLSYHPDWLAGAHVVIMGIPALELGVLSVFKDVLLALEVRVVEANEGAALHADGVDPVQEAAVLEVVTVAADLQLPPSEAFALIQHNLSCTHTQVYVIALSVPQQWNGCVFNEKGAFVAAISPSNAVLFSFWLERPNVGESSGASYYLVPLTFPEY